MPPEDRQGRDRIKNGLHKENASAALNLEQSLKNLTVSIKGIVQVMAVTVEKMAEYPLGHQERVSQLARSMAGDLGLQRDRIDDLGMASLVHDVGMLYIPPEVLCKTRKLTAAEYGLVKSHPRVGAEILQEVQFPSSVAQIVLQHHERLDGSGYPQGLANQTILLEAQILAVAEVVEAMTYRRPYRPARHVDNALKEIHDHKGTWYSPEAVDACSRLFAEKKFAFE